MNHQTQRRNHIRFYSLVSQSRNRQSRARVGTPPRGQVHDLFQLTTTTSQDVAPSQGGCLSAGSITGEEDRLGPPHTFKETSSRFYVKPST